jgi:membrane protein DedA with SNARE-associated domain
MEEFTLNLVDWIVELPLISIYAFFFIIAYTENVFPPIPGDLLIVFGGYLAVDQIVNLPIVLTITTIGSMMGFMTLYYLGYRLGDEIRNKSNRFRFMKYLDGKYMNKAELWMYRWGMGVILANRFLAGTRSIISIVAGVSRLKVSSTILYSTAGALIWNALLLALGWYIGENWQTIQTYLNYYGTTLLILLGLFFAYRLGRYYYKKKKLKTKKSYPEI